MTPDRSESPNSEPPTILILGAGALGRLWAALLCPFYPVRFLLRPGNEIKSLQYVYVSPDETTMRPCRIEAQASDSRAPLPTPAMLWVTTKAPVTVEAVLNVAPKLPESTPIVLFQNGMGSQQAVAKQLPDWPVIAASTTEGANRPDPGTLRHAGRGETVWGPLTPSGRRWLEPMTDVLRRAGVQGHPSSDIEENLWNKLAINAGINPFTLLLECRNGELPGHPYFEERIYGLCDELAGIMSANGYVREPESLEQRIRSVARATAQNRSSMLQDFMAGRPTEIQFINGYLAREAQRLGLNAPVNDELLESVLTKTLHL